MLRLQNVHMHMQDNMRHDTLVRLIIKNLAFPSSIYVVIALSICVFEDEKTSWDIFGSNVCMAELDLNEATTLLDSKSCKSQLTNESQQRDIIAK